MGIGRRDFLKLISLALAGIIIDPFQSVVTNNNIYVNRLFGIIFTKPQNWGFVSVTDFGKLKEDQILSNGWNDLKEEFWEEVGEPICIITKYHNDILSNSSIFSPTITLNISPKSDFQDLNINSLEELVVLSRSGASEFLLEYKVVKEYNKYFISGCPVIEYDSEYLLEHTALSNPLRIELKVIKVEHNDFFYEFNLHQSEEQNQIATMEYDDFIKSIRFV